MSKPSMYYVMYEDRRTLKALIAQTGHEDHDPALYYKERDCESRSEAVAFVKSYSGGAAYVMQRYGIEETAPGMWDWEQREVQI